MIYELQNNLLSVNKREAEEIKNKFEAFHNFYLVNQPFLSNSLIVNIKALEAEYQQCSEDFYVGQVKQQDNNMINEGALQQNVSLNKLKTDYFKLIREEIIAQMRSDLHIEDAKCTNKMMFWLDRFKIKKSNK
ncbi:MAG: hypothetical protein LBU51_07560 [Bacteroidales bacterium]|jgi:hypothetical protein|nr:hypothetical protein [Bacteroidales bacterium]